MSLRYGNFFKVFELQQLCDAVKLIFVFHTNPIILNHVFQSFYTYSRPLPEFYNSGLIFIFENIPFKYNKR